MESFLWISGISELSFFATEHISKPGNHGKFSEVYFTKYLFYLSNFEHFSKHFVCLRQDSQGVAQNYEGALAIEGWNWLFLLLKTKWYLFISGISEFSVFTINPETTENFQKLFFRGIKIIYLISSNFLGVLRVQDTILKTLVKEHLLLLLESGFSGYLSQNGA